jgi:predicted ester cyclase
MPSPEENKAVVRRYYDEVYSKGNLNVASEVLDAAYVQRSLNHSPGSVEIIEGPERIKRHAASLRATFPDFRYEIERLVAEGDTVVVTGTVRGTHQGELQGIAPSNKQMAYTSIHILRLHEGRIVEDWNLWDSLGWWQQLGAVPAAPELAAQARRKP